VRTWLRKNATRGRRETGPYPLSKLRHDIERQTLSGSDRIWKRGWPEWKQVDAMPELFADAPARIGPAGAADAAGATLAQPKPAARNYFVRHWNGDLTLPISFWVNGVGCMACLSAAWRAAGRRSHLSLG
jgi:hypothetical protein